MDVFPKSYVFRNTLYLTCLFLLFIILLLGQFYGVTLEYRGNPAEPTMDALNNVKSVVMLVFRHNHNF